MSTGMVLLTATAVLVYFGVAQRVLDKMRLSDRAALLMVSAMFFGGLIPDLQFGLVHVNIGGALVPIGVCLYLLFKADTGKEVARALIGSVLTAAAVYFLSRWLPDEPEAISIDPNYIYGLGAGLIAYILGRSRRAAFICGVLGVTIADTAVAVINWNQNIQQPLVLGGAGLFDAMVLSGLIGVILAELIGETTERLTRGKASPEDRPIENPVNDKEGGKA